MFFKMGLIEKIMWEVGEEYMLMPILPTFFTPQNTLMERI